MLLAHFSRIGGYGNQTPDLLHARPENVPSHHQPIIISWFDLKRFDPVPDARTGRANAMCVMIYMIYSAVCTYFLQLFHASALSYHLKIQLLIIF